MGGRHLVVESIKKSQPSHLPGSPCGNSPSINAIFVSPSLWYTGMELGWWYKAVVNSVLASPQVRSSASKTGSRGNTALLLFFFFLHLLLLPLFLLLLLLISWQDMLLVVQLTLVSPGWCRHSCSSWWCS